MPELPEVETVIRELRDRVTGRTIESLVEYRHDTIKDHRKLQSDLGEIESIDRRGKYILINTSSQNVIVVHLRMTGKLIYEAEESECSSHCRAEISFTDNSRLLFDDIRTFGTIDIYGKGELDLDAKLGAEPLSGDFNAEYLMIKFQNRKAPVKNLLLDQKNVAGLGNIYVCEILFRCGISPEKMGKDISYDEARSIVIETKQVLLEAIDSNGTTISDYRRVDDKQGEFQNFLRVYGKKQCSCGAAIKRIKQAGRSTFYCPECQKK